MPKSQRSKNYLDPSQQNDQIEFIVTKHDFESVILFGG